MPSRRPPSTRPRLAVAALAVALVTGVAGPLAAQPRAGAGVAPPRIDPVAAEALWNEGRKLRAAGRIREACPKFKESYRLDPALGTLLNLASCHELLGLTATAWSEYREAEDVALRTKDGNRRKFAAKRVAALEKRIPRLVITAADPPPGLVIQRDGIALGEAALGAPIPLDPGEHVISASAPGYAPWTTHVEAVTGKQRSLAIPRLQKAPEEASAVLAAPEPADRAAEPAGKGTGSRTGAIVAGGAGLAGIGVGVVFGVLTANQAATAEAECPGQVCNGAGDEAVARGETYAWASNIGFAAGAIGLVIGGVLLLTGGDDADPPPVAARAGRFWITPVIGGDGGGVRAVATF